MLREVTKISLFQHLLKNGWSLSELTQAICILAQFHALCCLVHGTGVEASKGEPPVQPAEMLKVY